MEIFFLFIQTVGVYGDGVLVWVVLHRWGKKD